MQNYSFFRIRPVAILCISGFGMTLWFDMENSAFAHPKTFAEREETLPAKPNSQQRNVLLQLLH